MVRKVSRWRALVAAGCEAIFLLACATLSTTVPVTGPIPATSAPISPTSKPEPTGTGTTAVAPTVARAAAAASFPDPGKYAWVPVADGLQLPDDIQFPDDGSGRMFVVEQPGRIRIVENGQLLPQPYLDIRDRVGSRGNEQGLLGLAFHPDFRDHPYLYVNYTDIDGNTVIARFTAEGNTVDPASENARLHISQPFPNHNGGGTVFGPDGYLYLGLGDGGSEGDPNGNGQNTSVLLGKILRIDVDHGDPYAIPPDNPFAHGGGKPEVWAYGLRNPWRFSFAKGTNDLYIADVGQDLWEEVDYAAGNPAGRNYGWNFFEGNHPFAGQPPPGLQPTMPVTEYSHADGGCAIIGGYVYAGQMNAWRGIYLYGDDCTGNIWGLLNVSSPPSAGGWSSQLLFQTHQGITTFGQDPSGEVYFAGRGGTIFRMESQP